MVLNYSLFISIQFRSLTLRWTSPMCSSSFFFSDGVEQELKLLILDMQLGIHFLVLELLPKSLDLGLEIIESDFVPHSQVLREHILLLIVAQ